MFKESDRLWFQDNRLPLRPIHTILAYKSGQYEEVMKMFFSSKCTGTVNSINSIRYYPGTCGQVCGDIGPSTIHLRSFVVAL
jgi:hypothetical protein